MDNVINQRVIIRKKDRGEYILNGLCDFWGVDMAYIQRPAHHNPRKRNQKYMAIYMLYNIADFPLKDIADVMGYAHSSLHTMGERRDEIADKLSGINGDKDLINEYNQILKHLQL